MKVTIMGIYRDAKETKFGPKIQVSLKIKEDSVKDVGGAEVSVAGKYIRGFFSPHDKTTASWNSGDEVEIDVMQKGEFLNFALAGKGKASSPSVDMTPVNARLDAIEARLTAIEGKGGTAVVEEVIEDEDEF